MNDLPPIASQLSGMAPDALKAALEKRHPEHEGDFGRAWWALVRASYEHGEGFRASLAPDTTMQGEASYTGSSSTSRVSYLRRFPRENVDVYQRRIASSTYENHVAPIVDVYNGHLTRRPPQRESASKSVSAWWERADAAGSDVQAFVERGLKAAQLHGWTLCLFDRPRGDTTRAEARTEAAWLQPEEVVNWQLGRDGALDWVRIGSESCERDPATGAEVKRMEFTVWTRTEFARVVLLVKDGAVTVELIDGAEHGVGRVPVAVLYWQRPLTPLRLFGISQVNDVVPLNLALFNRKSELTHHLRSAVFAILCVESDDPAVWDDIKLGTNNGIRHNVGTQAPQFIAPPPDVATTLSVECDVLKSSIYEAAKLERPHAEASGGDASSGIARSYDFLATEAALMSAVANLATWEYEAAAIVALWDAAPVIDAAEVAARTVADTTITYPQNFDAAGLARDLTAAFGALKPDTVGQVLPSTRRTARTRIARALSPDATPAEATAIEAEATALYEQEMAALNAATRGEGGGASSSPTTSTPGSSP